MAESPVITADGWGSLEAAGATFKDAKLWPGGARPWDWNETGTSHDHGMQVADADDLIAAGAEILIIGNGRRSRLAVLSSTISALQARGVEVEVLDTVDAIQRYNRLAQSGASVAALIHTTC